LDGLHSCYFGNKNTILWPGGGTYCAKIIEKIYNNINIRYL
jgi:hypothetical protein